MAYSGVWNLRSTWRLSHLHFFQTHTHADTQTHTHVMFASRQNTQNHFVDCLSSCMFIENKLFLKLQALTWKWQDFWNFLKYNFKTSVVSNVIRCIPHTQTTQLSQPLLCKQRAQQLAFPTITAQVNQSTLSFGGWPLHAAPSLHPQQVGPDLEQTPSALQVWTVLGENRHISRFGGVAACGLAQFWDKKGLTLPLKRHVGMSLGQPHWPALNCFCTLFCFLCTRARARAGMFRLLYYLWSFLRINILWF